MDTTHTKRPALKWRAACLERLATALSSYHDLEAAVRTNGPAPCLAICNTAAPLMSETVTVSASGGGVAYVWSWGQRITDASGPDGAARAIAYVLDAHGARLPAESALSGRR